MNKVKRKVRFSLCTVDSAVLSILCLCMCVAQPDPCAYRHIQRAEETDGAAKLVSSPHQGNKVEGPYIFYDSMSLSVALLELSLLGLSPCTCIVVKISFTE